MLARFGGNSSDLFIWHEIFSDGEYEVVDIVDPVWILDLGGNVGYAAVWFAKRYPKAQIITIEPENANFEILLANVCDEPRIHPIRAAVASAGAPRQVIMSTDGEWGGAGLQTAPVDENAETTDSLEVVDSVDGASILDRFGIERLDLMKIDVEGAEKDIFGSSEPWIDRVDAIVAELHDNIVDGCEETFARATTGFTFRRRYGTRSTITYVRREPPTRVG